MPPRKAPPGGRAGLRTPPEPGRAGAECAAGCGWPLDARHPAGLAGGHPCCDPGRLPGKMTHSAVEAWGAAVLRDGRPLSPSPWTAELDRLIAEREPLPRLI